MAGRQARRPAAEAEAVRDLERLARYVRDLLPLANNFVAFRDFYTRQGKATFQIGTLYLDGRSAELCISVSDAGKHAALASLSRMCLVYCDCVRGGERLSIAAAFTAGDSDQLMALRNGVFYDRQGRDWDATITKDRRPPDQPAPGLLVALQETRAWSASSCKRSPRARPPASRASSAEAATATAKKVGLPGRGQADTRAAGLRRRQVRRHLRRHRPRRRRHRHRDGAIVLTGLLGLKWWQMPLVFLGLMLLISGPAGDAGLVQAAQPQPRPHPRRQRLGSERKGAHQHPLRHLADATGTTARRRAAHADRPLCGEGAAVENLRGDSAHAVCRSRMVDALSIAH
jgi:hypothetical protein